MASLVAAGCSSADRSARPTSRVASPEETALHASIAHVDGATGAPTFLWLTREDGPAFADAPRAAAAALSVAAKSFALSPKALAAVSAPVVHDTGAGPIVARFEQRVSGIEIFRAGLSVALRRDFEPVAASGSLVASIAGSESPFVLTHREALDRAALALPGAPALAFVESDRQADYTRYLAAGLSQPARVKKVYFARNGGLVPAYYVELMLARGPAWSYVVSADDGALLFQNDLVRYDAFTYRTYASPQTMIPADGPQGNDFAPHPVGAPTGLKPTLGPASLVTLQNFPFSKNDPWLAPSATTTSGNNVNAYADLVAGDGFGAGDVQPTTSAAATFDYLYDNAQGPAANQTQIRGSVTNLFYVTNFMHDWFYDAGFDEKSGNHQADNFGRGGIAHDVLLAEAQDYSGRNNSNAATPADGGSARMQMFVFSGQASAHITVSAPGSIAGVKDAGTAGFGLDVFDLNGSVALVDDATGDAADACEPVTNALTGKIALVHRGTCSFVQKAQNAQNAGAVGVIIANVASSAQPTVAPFMGGTSSSVNIPLLSLSLADGQAMESALAGSAVSVNLKRLPLVDLDGALDNTVVSHEWGHTLSNRLIGNGNGLTKNQAGGLGEGWSDFVAMLLVVRADDVNAAAGANWAGAYPSGAYAMLGAGADFYFGIRRVPYSIDLKKDPLTFKHIMNGVPLPSDVPVSFGEDGSFNSEVHNVGEVWATMLWECYAALLKDGRYTFQQAQDRMKRYLVASLKLTPVEPTLLEARDAVLAAALATDDKDYVAFWQAFGRRGAGVGAKGPPKDSSDNAGVVESYVVGNEIAVDEASFKDDAISCDHDGFLDDGEVGTIRFTVHNVGTGPLSATTAKLSSPTSQVFFPGGDSISVPALGPFKSAKITALVSARAGGAPGPIELHVGVTDPSLVVARTIDVKIPTRYDIDEAPEASTRDDVETLGTAWTVAAQDASGTSKRWTRVTDGNNHWWAVPNAAEASQHALISPSFTLSSPSFAIAFKHRWSFRFSTRRQVDIDGGVLELSTDGGKTWQDLSKFGTVDYNTSLDDLGGRSDNPLKGRKAYGNKSAGYPDQWITSRIAVTLPDKPDALQIRFLAASGTSFFGTGAPGWEIDDIELQDIASKPFPGFVPHQDACDANGPTADAGQGKTVHARDEVSLEGSGTHPADAPLTFVWSQIAGPPVALRGADSAKLAFTAPDVGAPTVMTLSLRANDGRLLSPASNVEVTVLPAPAAPPEQLVAGGGCSCSTAQRTTNVPWLALALGAALAYARRRKARG